MSAASPSSAVRTSTSALSFPNRKGETIGQPPMLQNGRFRNSPSPPATRSNIAISGSMCATVAQLNENGLRCPASAA